MGEFETGGIMDGQGKSVGKPQYRAPGVSPGFGVDRDRQLSKVGERRVAVGGVDALAAELSSAKEQATVKDASRTRITSVLRRSGP